MTSLKGYVFLGWCRFMGRCAAIIAVSLVGLLPIVNISCTLFGNVFKRSSPKIFFREEEHDFGVQPRDIVIFHTFQVFNAGNDTLIISKIETTCGCTTAMLTSDHIAPGDSGKLMVSLSLVDRVGKLDKQLTVYSNDPDSRDKQIRVSVEIAESVHNGTMHSPAKLTGIFSAECATCHKDNGVGRMDRELYDVDCAMCHGAPSFHGEASAGTIHHLSDTRDKPGPGLTNLSLKLLGADGTRGIIAKGKQGTTMPAFGRSIGGSLDEQQLESLVRFLVKSSGVQYP
jgi:mono/diheme cytochrome c family protein